MKRTLSIPVFLIALGLFLGAGALSPALGKSDQGQWCGTTENAHQIELAKDAWYERRALRERLRAASGPELKSSNPEVVRSGNVAVLKDNGTILREENLFANGEAPHFKVRHKKRAKTSKVSRLGGNLSTNLGDKIELGDDATIRIDFPAGVRFRFYTERYTSFFLNSDGNITFGQPDTATSARDLSRAVSGPPRIAPFFFDLDPSQATGDGGVYVRYQGKKTQVTWHRVPEFGGNRLVTVQLTMFASGKIFFRFGDIQVDTGVIGIAPGADSALELVDLSEDLPLPPTTGAVAESFTEDEDFSETAATRAFLNTFRDEYHTIILFLDFQYVLVPGRTVIAYEQTPRQSTRGIGRDVYNASRSYGSNGTLESVVNMGYVNKYDRRPHFRTWFNQEYSAMDILTHEVGHRWGVSVDFIDDSGARSEDLLGRFNVHWSYRMDSDASVLEGNELRDNGDGTYTSVKQRRINNDMDLYLMGMIPADQVAPFYYIADGSGPPADTAPQAGVTIAGDRVDVTVDQVIAAEGNRRPSADTSKKDLKMAFVLVTRDGAEPTQNGLDRVEGYRAEWETHFVEQTLSIGTSDTTLVER